MAEVVCFGEMLFDCLADQLGVPLEQVKSWTNYAGGAPANVACALVKQGVSAAFVGRLGADQAGQELKNVLQQCQVNTDGLQIDRHFAGFGEYHTGDFADTAMQGETIPESLFTSAQYLVMGTIALAYAPSRTATERLVALAKKHQVKIFLDVNWRSVFWDDEAQAKERIPALITHAQILKCTDEEAVWLFGHQDPVTIHQKLPHLQGVLVTAGDKGCSYSLGKNHGEVPAFKVNVRDTTGAGDSFVAGFLAQALTHGENLFIDPHLSCQAVTYASAIGALTTLHPGAIAR